MGRVAVPGLLAGVAACFAISYAIAENPVPKPAGTGFHPYTTPESLNWTPPTPESTTLTHKPGSLGETERHSIERFHIADTRTSMESVRNAGAGTGTPPTTLPRVDPAYSGDAREWAERFQQEIPIGNPLHSAAGPENVSRGNIDGQPIGNMLPAKNRSTTADVSLANPPPAPKPGKALAPLDLSPSYPKYLPFSQVRGAVVCEANFPFSEMGALLDEIEDLQIDLTRYMGIPEAREKIVLCLFRDEKSYIDFLAKVFPEAPRDRRALFIKVKGHPGTLLVQRTRDFEIDLRHEMTHAIIHAGIENVPIWLDEGLAKYFEQTPVERAHGNPYLKTIARNNMFGIVPNLERLEKLQDISEMGPKEYRDSWAWIHFMIHYSPETHKMLAGYLQLLGSLPPERKEPPTLSGYLKDHLSSPRSAYGTHFKSWTRN